MDLEELLPVQIGGWTAKNIVTLKTPGDLYSYMDGGAELYLSYSFKEALSRTYIRENAPEVIAEVYDLNTSRDAFGVFTQSRENETDRYGQKTYLIPGAVIFWKDHYYFSLSSWDVTPECNEFMEVLATHLSNSINENGEIPMVMSLLPQQQLTSAGYKYFHHPVWINSFFFITDQNIFLINQNVNAVIAKYEETAEKRKYLLIIDYENEDDASMAFALFGRQFFPDGLNGNCKQTDDGSWISAKKAGRILVAVFNASSCESALLLLNQISI